MHYNKYRLIIPFLLPAVVLYGLFVVYPYAQAIYVSLTDWGGFTPEKPFVGFDNSERLWGDNRFRESLTRNGQLLIALPLLTIGIALTFAALFSQGAQSIRGSNFYRIVFFFPQVIPAVIAGMLWGYVYTPNIGLLRGVLRIFGWENPPIWLNNPSTVLWAIVAVAIWSSVGFYMVIFLASMQGIPTSFYEAATLDGASRWSSFRDITFPLIWETLRTSLIYLAISALDFFVLIQVISGGSSTPGARRAEVAALYMYNQAFDRNRWGYATAIGVVLLVITLFLSVVLMRITKRETYEF